MNEEKRYHDLNRFLRRHFGCRIQKITVDAGFTCPNRDGTLGRQGCIYCNARGSGTGAFARGLSIREQVEAGKAGMAKRYKAKGFIAYFQAFTNTYAPIEVLQKRYEEALAVPGVVGLAIGTRPDCVDGAVLDLLQSYTNRYMVWIEYGLQSIHDATLTAIHRGHDYATFRRAVEATRGRGILTCAHIILGLPGETAGHMRQTARAVAALGLDGIKIHLLYVVRGTRLARLHQQGEYRCLTQSDYADRVCDVLERLPPQMVIQRLTGDPHPEELVAPDWALRKRDTLALIHRRLEERETFQGRLYNSAAGPAEKTEA
ncbi:MAG: TIGR01212 family radical SAM protein [Desulfobacteraceae bacterium]|nr:TIGR01212 family radical SAM protein [Desulfobacteraceae bacterium]